MMWLLHVLQLLDHGRKILQSVVRHLTRALPQEYVDEPFRPLRRAGGFGVVAVAGAGATGVVGAWFVNYLAGSNPGYWPALLGFMILAFAASAAIYGLVLGLGCCVDFARSWRAYRRQVSERRWRTGAPIRPS